MPEYKVTYETDTKPASYTLPGNAKVTKVSVLPLHIDPASSYSYEDVNLEKSNVSGTVAFLEVGLEGTWLKRDEAKKLVEGLQELIDA